IEHCRGDFLITANQADQERCSALNIQPERDLLFRWPDREQAKHREQHHQRSGKTALSRSDVGCKVPTEQNQKAKTNEECQGGTHKNRGEGERSSSRGRAVVFISTSQLALTTL